MVNIRYYNFKKKLKTNGLKYLFFLIKKNFFTLHTLFFPITFFLCLIIYILKPIIFIRFGDLNAEKIGPLSSHSELILCEKDHNIQPQKSFDIYFSSKIGFVCNKQLLLMIKRRMRVWEYSIFFYKVMKFFPLFRQHVINPSKRDRDIHGLLEKSKIHLSFLNNEISQAETEIKTKMGITNKDKYVLIINRGKRYFEETFKDLDLSYHSYRYCSIQDFLPMGNMLTKKDYFVIRMGQKVDDLMKTNNSKIIEYDEKGYRSDLLDIFLSANCKFIVGVDTGFYCVAGWNFRKPVVAVNFSQMEYIEPWLSNWLFIFRKYWSKSEKRFLKIHEIIKSGVGRLHRTEEILSRGIELVDNTPEEIKEVVEEMELRLEKKWNYNEEDEEIQKKFWSNFKLSPLHGAIRSRIGSKFLKKNLDLL